MAVHKDDHLFDGYKMSHYNVLCHYIICSSCALSCSDTHVRMLEDCIQETILEQNKLAAGSDRSESDNVSLASSCDFCFKSVWIRGT